MNFREHHVKKKFLELSMTVFLLVGVFFLAREGAAMVFSKQELTKEKIDENAPVVVVDAGHGGSDPGKIGIHKEQEKDINLKIALLLKDELEESGIRVVMTRQSDKSLGTSENGNQKVQDLKKRCELIDETKPVCAISIHQNSYPQEAIKGAQVFYFSSSTEGKKLAEILQNTLVEELDKENHRKAKENTSYYMLKKTAAPLVIVECGFLSNSQESALLSKEEYQEKVAKTICKGTLIYLKEKENKD